MRTVSTYNFESNALYVSERLHNSGINSILIKTESAPKPMYEIRVDTMDWENAKTLIDSMNIDESEVDSESEGYLDGHAEWSAKMYDPGHYTGGKIPHYLFNKDAWKYLAPLYIFGGILLIILSIVFNSAIGLESILWIGLYFFVGVSMIWQLGKRKKGS